MKIKKIKEIGLNSGKCFTVSCENNGINNQVINIEYNYDSELDKDNYTVYFIDNSYSIINSEMIEYIIRYNIN